MTTIPQSCRAAVIKEYHQPIVVEEVPVPQELEPGGMLVKVEVGSICGTDIHLWEGVFSYAVEALPVIPGHEMVGTIVDPGIVRRDSVGQPLAVGDRIVWSHGSCGQCFWCRVAKQESLCPNRRYYMFTCCQKYPYLVGGFAEYCYVFPESGRVKVPEGIKNEWASAAACALRSVVHAFERLGYIRDTETVVVQGSGPIGLFSVALAKRAGAERIIVIGAPQARLEVAKKWGADQTISIEGTDHPGRLKQVMDLTGGRGGDIVIEASGAKMAFREGVDLVRRGGRYLVVGQVGGEDIPFGPSWLVRKEMTVLGSWSGDISDYYKALLFLEHNQGRFDFDALLTNRYPLDQINAAFTAMQAFQEIKPVVLLHSA